MIVRRPVRTSHTFTQHIGAEQADVFPRLCPVLEREWIPGWDPRLVLSESGVAEKDAIFMTDVEGREAIWVITVHEPTDHYVEMVEVVPGLVVIQLAIRVDSAPEGTESTCDVSYTYTALSEEGKAFVAARTPEWYRGFMDEWERLINEYVMSSSSSGDA